MASAPSKFTTTPIITLSLILIRSSSTCTSSDDLHSLSVTAGKPTNQAKATVHSRFSRSKMPTSRRPDLRTTDPTSASEHPAALVPDFEIPCPFSQAGRSYTGRDRRSPPAGLQIEAADAWSDENTLSDLSEPTALEGFNHIRTSEEPPAGYLKQSKRAFDDSLGMENRFTFTITLDDLVVAGRVESMDNEQKRLLVCQATKRDPHEIATHSGTRWIKAVRQESSDTLRVYCYDLHERLLLQRAAILPQDLESIVNADIETFGVLMQNVRLLSLNLQPGVRNHAATQMLATANAHFLPSLSNHKDCLSVRREKDRKGSVANLVVEFATPQQANEAILHGLIWNDKSHRCRRLVEDSEVQKCSNCQRFGHTLSDCTNETRCEQCFGPHPSTDCFHRPQTCNCCGKMHSRGTLCSFYSAERRKAKEVLQSQQPLWPVTQGSNTSLPLRFGSDQSVASSSPIPKPYQRAALRGSEQIRHQANVRPHSTYGSTQLAGATAASTRGTDLASIVPAPAHVEAHASAMTTTVQLAGYSGASVADTQHSGQGPESERYEALIREVNHLRSLVNKQVPNSPIPLQSSAPAPAVMQPKKRKAITASHVETADESHSYGTHSYGKRVKHTQSPTPPIVMAQLEDPVATYIRENGCVTVEAGEGLRNALERAGIVTEPPPRAEPWRRRRRSPVVESTWYKWSPYERKQPNAYLEACPQPRDLNYGGNRSMTEQRGHGLPASHQLPYSYRYDDRSGVR